MFLSKFGVYQMSKNEQMSKLVQLHKLILTLTSLLISAVAMGHPALSGGFGTYDDPYLISTKADLLALSDYVNHEADDNKPFYYLMTEDIDMSGVDFEPINCYKDEYDYKVNFDGGNHKITNLTIAKDNNYCGLFGRVNGNHLYIKDLTIENLSIDVETSESEVYVGGVIAYFTNPTQSGSSTLSNCKVSGSISMKNYTQSCIGGIVGYSQCIDISNCKNYANINVEYGYVNTSLNNGIGGIVGKSTVPAATGVTKTLSKCSNFGNVTGPMNVGGIGGYTLGITASQNNNTGHITFFDDNAGGIIGFARSTLIDFCCNIGAVTISFDGVDNKSVLTSKYIGGIAGYSKVDRTVTAIYPFADNLNAGYIDGWNFTGGVCGFSNGWTYNNVNVAPVNDGSEYLAKCFSGATIGSYPYADTKGVKDSYYGGSIYDKQMSLIADSMNGKVFEDKVQIYELYSNQLVYDSVYNHFISILENQGPHGGVYNWIYNENVYAVPNDIDLDFNVLASAIIKLDSSDRANDVNHQFKIVMMETGDEVPEIISASNNKICKVVGTTIGLVGTGKDTLRIFYKGMMREIPLIINSVDTLMFSGGAGTSEDPYLISNLKDLKELKYVVNNYSHSKYPEQNWSYEKYFKVTKDIDDAFEGNIGERYPEIKEFQGHFNGNGKRITIGIEEASNYAALFTIASEPASITNLEVNGEIYSCKLGAGIVGLGKHISIDSCLNTTNIVATDTAGGIIAKAYDCSFSSCGNNGFVRSNKVSGGLVGYANNCEVKDAVNGGSVVSAKTAGGLIGSADNSALTTGVNYGYTGRTTNEIDGTNIGYIVGLQKNSTIGNTHWCAQTNTIWDETWETEGLSIKAMLTDATFKEALNGAWDTSSETTLVLPKALKKFEGRKLLTLPYSFDNAWNTLKDVNETFSVPGSMFKSGTYDNTLAIASYNEKFTPKEDGTILPNAFGADTLVFFYYYEGVANMKNRYRKIVPTFCSNGFASGGKGTKEDPYKISSEKDFTLLLKTVSEDYYCVDTFRNASWHKYFVQTTDLTNEHTTPIGNSNRQRYEWNGFYDGGGHSITLNINSKSDYTALFPIVSKNSSVSNLIVNGSVKGECFSGAIAGILEKGSSVIHCKSNASVTGTISCGGIVGSNMGGTISTCYNNGPVNGTINTGGICGYSDNGSRNYDLANLGDISGELSVGGIIGFVDSCDVRRAVNAGIVQGLYAVGGVAGSFRWSGETGNLIYECMNFGFVDYEETKTGAIVGENINNGTNVTLCFYNNQLTLAKAVDGADNEGFATGLSTSELTGFNLDAQGYYLGENWTFTNSHYPMPKALEDEEAKLISNPAFIAEGEIYINIGTEFEIINDNNVKWSSATGKLAINDNMVFFNKAGRDTLIAELNGFTKRQPLFITNGLFSGGNGSKSRPYRITCKKDMEDLAEYVNTNILEVDKSRNWSDGLYFSLENDIPEDSVISTTIGIPESELESEYIHFGGIFQGHGHKLKVNISGDADNVGLFGYIRRGIVDSLTIYGKVTGTSNVGGFAGYIEHGTVTNCINEATVSGYNDAGGISGYISDGEISNCSNSGLITSKENKAGGIVGETNKTKINGCVNIAEIAAFTLNSYSGGIVGKVSNDSEVDNCLNAGAIKGESRVGGIAGEASNSDITNCLVVNEVIHDGALTNSKCGYICGQPSAGTSIKNCYFDKQLAQLEGASDASKASGLTTAEMTNEKLKATLPETNWIFTENNYPRPTHDTIALLASSALLFIENNTNRNVTDQFGAYTYPDCNWKSTTGKVSFKSGNATLSAFGLDTLVAYSNNKEKKVVIDIQCITIRNQDTITGCDSVEYENKYYFENISFNDTLKSTITGCDSLVGISIVVKHTTYAPTLPEIFALGSYEYEGVTYVKDTVVTTIKENAEKCDSIIKQKINIVQTRIEHDTIPAQCDSTLYNALWFYKDTTIEAKFKDDKDRDTLVTYTHIFVNYSLTETADSIKGYDSLTFNGITYLKDTVIIDTTQLETGCNHIVKTPIHVGKTTRKYSNKTYCAEGTLYLSSGKITVTNDTIVNDTTKFDENETNITIYNVTIMQPKDTTIYYTNCDTIHFRGKIYSESTQIDTAYGTEWCDSTVHYVLTVLKPTIEEQSIQNCYVTKYKGVEYTENAVVYDTLKNQNHYGCDSIIKINIIVNKSTSDTLHTYGEGSKTVYGHYVTNDSTIVDTLVNSVGCDSFLVTQVHITHLVTDTITLYGCDSLTIEGKTYDKTTTLLKRTYDPYMQWDDLDQKTQSFEKHLQYMHIIIGKYQEYTEYIDSCDQITFRGKIYRESAEIRDSFVSKSGCDSIMVYKLRLHQPKEKGRLNLTGCGIVFWNGQSFYRDTTFEQNLVNKWGCDSICEITINVRQPDEVHIIEDGCNYVEYNGEVYDHDTLVTRVLTNEGGCDSTIYAQIKVYHPTYNTITLEGEYDVTYKGRKYTRSTVMRDTLVNQWGCDSILTIAIIVTKSLDYPIVVNKYNYMLLCNNNIGSDRYTSYQWYKNGQSVYGETKAYYSETVGNKLAGCYQVYVTTDDGREYFSEEICIDKEKELKVYPNPVAKGEPVTIDYDFSEAQKKGLYIDVYNSAGLNIYHDVPTEFPIVIPGQLGHGYYFILITTGEDKNMGAKFIVK